jgi:hypothetical protein
MRLRGSSSNRAAQLSTAATGTVVDLDVDLRQRRHRHRGCRRTTSRRRPASTIERSLVFIAATARCCHADLVHQLWFTLARSR